MKLNVDRLEPTPREYAFEAPPAWWRERSRTATAASGEVDEPFAFALEAHTAGTQIVIEGGFGGAIGVECSRCAARYRHALRDSYRLVLEPAGERIPADPEGAKALARDGMVLGDEIEAGWYRGSEIHLDAFFAEVVSLAMPVQPLCSDDCAGLCPRCGADRNQAPCDCEELKPESPFAVLAALKLGDSRGEH